MGVVAALLPRARLAPPYGQFLREAVVMFMPGFQYPVYRLAHGRHPIKYALDIGLLPSSATSAYYWKLNIPHPQTGETFGEPP